MACSGLKVVSLAPPGRGSAPHATRSGRRFGTDAHPPRGHFGQASESHRSNGQARVAGHRVASAAYAPHPRTAEVQGKRVSPLLPQPRLAPTTESTVSRHPTYLAED